MKCERCKTGRVMIDHEQEAVCVNCGFHPAKVPPLDTPPTTRIGNYSHTEKRSLK